MPAFKWASITFCVCKAEVALSAILLTACAVGIVVANAVAAAAAAAADTVTAVTTAAVMPKSLLFLDKIIGSSSSVMETGRGKKVGTRIITATENWEAFQHCERKQVTLASKQFRMVVPWLVNRNMKGGDTQTGVGGKVMLPLQVRD